MNEQIQNMSAEEKAQFQAQLKQKLGLPEEASDFEVEAALVVMVASLAEASQKALADRDSQLNEAAKAQEQIANREIDSYKDVVSPETKPFWVAQLLANRKDTLAVLDSMRSKLATANSLRLSNRVLPVPTRTPTDESSAKLAENVKKAVTLRNRADQLQREFGMTFQDAWERASNEIDKLTEA